MDLPKISSISKKVVVALVGLFLLLFLAVHLGINLCLLRSDGGKWFVDASNFMGTNYIVKVFEVVLLAAIAIHIVITLLLQFKNWKARPVRYRQPQKTKTSTGSKLTIYTGVLILCFLVLHFCNFYFVKKGIVEGKYMVKIENLLTDDFSKDYMRFENGGMGESEAQDFLVKVQGIREITEKAEAKGLVSQDGLWITQLSAEDIEPVKDDFRFQPDFYHMSVELFRNKAYSITYIILFFVLGLHLVHAFQSACQTLGLNHNKYNRFIEVFSWFYAVAITLGFTAIPVYFMFFF